MKPNLKTIHSLLIKTKISRRDQQDLLFFLALTRDENLGDLSRVLSDDISLAESIIENFKKKEVAGKKFNKDDWQTIFDEECMAIKTLH